MSELCAANALTGPPRRPMPDQERQFAPGRDADRICRVPPAAREQLVEERAIDAKKHRRRAMVVGRLATEAGSRISPALQLRPGCGAARPADAFGSAEWVADAVHAGFSGARPLGEAMTEYQRFATNASR